MEENVPTKEIFLDCFLRIFPWELKTKTVKRGRHFFIKISLNKLTIYSQKVSLVGKIMKIYTGKKFTDLVLETEESLSLIHI